MPVQTAITSYFKAYRNRYSDSTLSAQLRESGWNDRDIRDSLAALNEAEASQTPAREYSPAAPQASSAWMVPTLRTGDAAAPLTTIARSTEPAGLAAMPDYPAFVLAPNRSFAALHHAAPPRSFAQALRPTFDVGVALAVLLTATLAFFTQPLNAVLAARVGTFTLTAEPTMLAATFILTPVITFLLTLIGSGLVWLAGRALNGKGALLHVTHSMALAGAANAILFFITLAISVALAWIGGATHPAVVLTNALLAFVATFYALHVLLRAVQNALHIPYGRAMSIIILIGTLLLGAALLAKRVLM